MAYTFAERELWGGHVVVKIPNELLDASDVRPVPDNQECFTTKDRKPIDASLVFEILEHVQPASTSNDSVHGEVADHSAIRYHMDDLLQSPHTYKDITPPSAHTLGAPGMAQFQAYSTEAKIVQSRHPSTQIPTHSPKTVPQNQDDVPTHTTRQQRGSESEDTMFAYLYLLVIRMPAQAADILVQLNINAGEMDPEQRHAALVIMNSIVKSLEIKDMALFGEHEG